MTAKRQSRLDNLERVLPCGRQELHTWLSSNHLTSPGMWLIRYRQNAGEPRLAISDIVEELLCFGWIDSKLVKLDETRTMLLCTPRRPGSVWAKTNKERVERLTEAGLMQPRGLEVVARARENGSWDSLNDVDALVVPQDLQDALDAIPGATRHWETYPASYRRQVLYWLQSAKRPETRRTRVGRVVSAAALNARIWNGRV